MKYRNVRRGIFIDRPNRFIARVEIDGREEVVHVKNTGRCRELLLPGKRVYLEAADHPNRKTKWDLIGVEKDGVGVVNIDSQAPNAVVKEWLSSERSPFQAAVIHPEHRYGNSRIDFFLEMGARKILIEVKGCTLEVDGEGFFPDAPTRRGAKHLGELAAAAAEGYECYILYCIGVNGVTIVHPNRATDPEYADAYESALGAGVKPIFLPCRVTEDSMTAMDPEETD